MKLVVILFVMGSMKFQFGTSQTESEVGNRIFGGIDADITDVPWQAQILRIPKRSKEVLIPMCGAAIIGPRHFITASHCFRKGLNNPTKYLVRAGSSLSNGFNGTLYRVVSIQIHADYNVVLRQHSINDIAVGKVDPPFTFGSTIQEIDLVENNPVTGEKGFVSGWGYKDLRKSIRPLNLQVAELTVMEREYCNTETKWAGMVPKKSFCAGGDGRASTCKGDSGGPFVIKNALAGIVSWGYSEMCSRKNYPTVFTSVAEFLPWIKEQLADE